LTNAGGIEQVPSYDCFCIFAAKNDLEAAARASTLSLFFKFANLSLAFRDPISKFGHSKLKKENKMAVKNNHLLKVITYTFEADLINSTFGK
jgi:hypothetical protein